MLALQEVMMSKSKTYVNEQVVKCHWKCKDALFLNGS